MGDYAYFVCDTCAHVETRPSAADDPSRCENCHSVELWRFSALDKAEQHSQDIIERKATA